MQRHSLSHLADSTLFNALDTVIAHHCASTADVLAHVAEFDARQLYLPAGYPSMFVYCVDKLHLCEQAAFKRIHAARAARRFPAIFEAVADGRLHLSAVVLLAAHLTEDTAEELLSAATHKSKAQIEKLLAARFPRPDVLAWVAEMPVPAVASSEPVPCQLSPGKVEVQETPATRPRTSETASRSVKPLSPQSYAVQFTLSRRAHDRLRYAQELLGHKLPSGDLAQVIEEAIDALVEKLEQRKFAATTRPRGGQRRNTRDARHIPAHVKRAVWKRDQGRCTFVSASGHRCPARARLEFDHIHEFARGGEATVSNTRLRCRAHNQYEAGRAYGPEFMRQKRAAAAEARAAAKLPTAAHVRTTATTPAAEAAKRERSVAGTADGP